MATGTFARHEGRCPECQEKIFVGDLIVYIEADQAWLHDECADDAEPVNREWLEARVGS